MCVCVCVCVCVCWYVTEMGKSGNMLPKYVPPTAFVIIVEGLRVSHKERGGGGGGVNYQ